VRCRLQVRDLQAQQPAGRQRQRQLQHHHRSAATLFGLSTTLLRLVDFLASRVPGAFLLAPAPGAPAAAQQAAVAADARASAQLQLQRLLEVLGFLLAHFTSGAQAKRMAAVLLDGHGQQDLGPSQGRTGGREGGAAAGGGSQAQRDEADEAAGAAGAAGAARESSGSRREGGAGLGPQPQASSSYACINQGMTQAAALAPAAGGRLG
jgi:hypothetical protein